MTNMNTPGQAKPPNGSPTPSPTLTVKKIGWTVPISCCMAREYGMDVECNHPPRPKPSRRLRLHRWLRDRWYYRPRVHFGPCDHEDCGW